MSSKISFVLGVTMIGSAIAVCNLSGNWAPACISPKMISLTSAQKQAIVDTQNKFRNDLATGRVTGYAPAVNMATLQWDDKLAANAALNVHQCEVKADDCRATAQFPNAGQNIGVSLNQGQVNPDYGRIFDNLALDWINQYKNGDMNIINRFPGPGSGATEVGKFTQLIWGKAFKVGCAIAVSKKDGWDASWIACDYSSGNQLNAAVYEAGPAGSKCTTGRDRKWTGLCSVNEKY